MKNWLIRIGIITFVINSIFSREKTLLPNNTCNCGYLNECIEMKCKHKGFFPITIMEIIGCFAIFIGSAVSNAGGIGGGGLLIPILILILKFEIHEGIPLSKMMIFSGALTAFVMGLKNSNPFRNTIAIDYNIAGIMLPLILFGTMIGVSLNKLFPAPLILFSLTLVLVINTYKTIIKGIKEYKKENEIMMKNIRKLHSYDENDDEDNEMTKLDPTPSLNINDDHTLSTVSLSISSFGIDNNLLLNNEYAYDKILFPKEKLFYMFTSFIVLLIITITKGSDSLPSFIKIENCSYQYWLIYLSFLPICLWLTYKYSHIITTEYNRRLLIHYPYHSADIKWTSHIILYYPLIGLFGGIMAGLLGIGGGLILGPLLLDLGLHPIVSTATSNFLVLFTSSSTTLQFFFHGMLDMNYGMILVICSSIGSYFGTVVIQKLVKDTGRASLLIFTLGIVLGLSTLQIPSYTLYRIIMNTERMWKFGNVC